MKTQGRAIRQWRAAFVVPAMAMLSITLAAACTRGDAAPRGKVVAVTERDFKLTTKTLVVPAGLVTFRVHNLGASTHEFNVDRTDLPADALPLRADGLSVNEDSKRMHRVGSMDGIRMDATRELTLTLAAGHYVVYCNLEGHYLGGMYALIQVVR